MHDAWSHVANVLEHAEVAAKTLLFVMPSDKLAQCEVARFPWERFSLLLELEPMPTEESRLAAQLQPRLCHHILHVSAPSDADADADARTCASPTGHADGGAAAGDARAVAAQLGEVAKSLRAAQRKSFDQSLDVSALMRKAADDAHLDRVRASTVAGDTAGSAIAALHVGEAALRMPWLIAMLRRKVTSLVETSMSVPHIVVDHETGVLIVPASALLGSFDEVLVAVRRCEVPFNTLWVLVLVGHSPDEKRRGARGDEGARAIWPSVSRLLSQTCTSPLRVAVRVATSGECWSLLRPIIEQRAAAADDGGGETQHEALLVLCGLNSCAARRIIREHSLRDFLSLSAVQRAEYFKWIPARATRMVSSLVGGENESVELHPVKQRGERSEWLEDPSGWREGRADSRISDRRDGSEFDERTCGRACAEGVGRKVAGRGAACTEEGQLESARGCRSVCEERLSDLGHRRAGAHVRASGTTDALQAAPCGSSRSRPNRVPLTSATAQGGSSRSRPARARLTSASCGSSEARAIDLDAAGGGVSSGGSGGGHGPGRGQASGRMAEHGAKAYLSFTEGHRGDGQTRLCWQSTHTPQEALVAGGHQASCKRRVPSSGSGVSHKRPRGPPPSRVEMG